MQCPKQSKHDTTDWQYHIDNYRNSDQSKAMYCTAHDLHQKQFEYHYRRWYENLKEERESETNPTPAQFSPVIVKPATSALNTPEINATSSSANSGIELQLGSGVRCKVEANFCKVTLKQVMELIR